MIVPIVAVCTIGLFATVFNFVERNKLQRIHLTINGDIYIIDAPSRHIDKGIYYSNWAIDFCSREGSKLGFDLATLGKCTTPLLAVLQQKPTLGKRDRYITVDLNANNEIDVSSLDLMKSIASEAAEEGKTINSCATSNVAEQDATTESNITAEPTLHKIPLEINSITYIFEYAVSAVAEERQAIGAQLASAFCSAHGESLIDRSVLDRAVAEQEGEDSDVVAQRRLEILERLLREECSKPITGALVANMLYPDQLL